MYSFSIFLTAATLASAQSKGFNYGNLFTNGAPKQQADFENEFNLAKNLPNAPGFNSARLFTMIQGGTPNTPISAIQAALNTDTQLLLGLWASAGPESFNNELAALSAAVQQYGTAFTDKVVGISVGSEDLYRNSPTGIAAKSGPGANPQDLVNYIGQVRNLIAGNALNGKPVGHVDTWNDYVNGSNSAVIANIDFLGVDAYPYYESSKSNAIDNSHQLFEDAFNAVKGVAQGKPVWITETGWPVSGPQSGAAVANVDNAKRYWDETACSLFGNTNFWYFTVQDAVPGTPSPSFGIVGSGGGAPLFDLSCPA
ncbi:GPI-anchored cell wall beta-1,3-endoglucanase EglC [Pseudovirgaria hyperparasitica]|uniref:Probable glucan endo-1,3-beta-glucosidase eglC n=1 Tax=Pseudovirgaria hyperparasitica TaxID=470096 RepID=A0A6A6VVC6_9PEZI|nr:GPI-anchored cell wall beta-1,3-endoglucanase EglC [Pseudovirgaria hyperparasitica]KAF2754522.1 GPI-anchored cell wall beta-1,3-endoglucanase EglC [Pseudovirgaria hyperparasitica]